MTNETEMKPCPYCGGTDAECDGHFVQCNDCHATGPDEPLPDRNWSAQRWNRRPLEEQAAAEIERLQKRIAELERAQMRSARVPEWERRDEAHTDSRGGSTAGGIR